MCGAPIIAKAYIYSGEFNSLLLCSDCYHGMPEAERAEHDYWAGPVIELEEIPAGEECEFCAADKEER